MVRSMTGYGQGEVQAPGGACVVEVRSLNHRYCEIAVKMPRGFAVLENHIREAVRSRFARGRFDVHVTVNYATVSSRRIVIDQALARQLLLALRDLKSELGLDGQVDLSTLLELREIARVEENEHHLEDLRPAVQEALDGAVANLEAMRVT